MRFTILLTLCLLPTAAIKAQDMGNARYGNNSNNNNYSLGREPLTNASAPLNDEESGVELKVQGLLNVVPSQYVAMFNVLQIGPTQADAERLLRERLASFTRGLRTAGFDTTTFRIDVISLVPRYETQPDNRLFSKRYNEVPAGFELQKTISIPYPRAGQLSTILALAGPAEIYDLVKVDCSVPDVQKAQEELRTACLAAFKAKERAYIAAGFRLDTLRKTFAEASNSVYPTSRYTRYQAAARPSFEALRRGLLGLGKAPTITEAAQNTVYYYAPVAYDHYDVVLNPVVTQPVVQFSYSFAARYQPRHRGKNKYYFINAAGQAAPMRIESPRE
jgi:uncharacterized protein YggE